jgi:nicotinamide mononucleotide (NMN) deamidase PncC
MAVARTDIAEPGGVAARKKPGTDWVTDSQKRASANKGSRRAAQLHDPRTEKERQAAKDALALPRIVIFDEGSSK